MNRKLHVANAFTLVELLVVLTMIGILMAMLLPAIDAVRESARRAQCTNNVTRLIVAVQNYEGAHEVYPAGVVDNTGPIRNQERGYHHSWIVKLLPYVEEKNTYRHIDPSVGVYHKNNEPVRCLNIGVLTCPTQNHEWRDIGVSNYAAVHHDVEAPIDVDNHGVFFLSSRVRYEDIADGLSQTLFIGERTVEGTGDLGWMSGTRATLRNTGTPINRTGTNAPGTRAPLPERQDNIENDPSSAFGEEDSAGRSGEAAPPAESDAREDSEQPDGDPGGSPRSLLYVGGFGSHHPTGAIFAFGDGQVRFLSEEIDQQTFQQMGHRADGKLLSAEDMDP